LPRKVVMLKTRSISPQLRNLRRVVLLRAIEVGVQLAVIATAVYALGIALPANTLFELTAGLALANLLTWWRLYQPWPVTDVELAGHLFVDIGVLTALLYFSGGSTNPFITLYLLPLSIAAAILPLAYTWTVAATALACYTLLMFFYAPLPEGAGSVELLDKLLQVALHDNYDAHGARSGFGLHLLGMWLNFTLSAVLIAWFVARMAQSLRERDLQLSQAREETLRNEQVLALGTLAAGAAHELGTPLSTMAVIATELERDHTGDPALTRDLRLLRSQTERCKIILTRLTARAEEATRVDCECYLQQLIEQWQLARPQNEIRAHFSGPQPAPEIVVERTLDQSIINLLNNAADVSPHGIELDARWNQTHLTLEIRDHGPGISAEVASRAGEAFFTTKAPGGGLGIGLFLTNATIERLGGAVSLFNHDGGGACARVTLPLQRLGNPA
jgi:two-component system sensor histidine kinase RegB